MKCNAVNATKKYGSGKVRCYWDQKRKNLFITDAILIFIYNRLVRFFLLYKNKTRKSCV